MTIRMCVSSCTAVKGGPSTRGWFDAALSEVVWKMDTIVSRLLLGRVVVILRDAGKISKKLAALAIIELDQQDSACRRG